MNWDLFAAFLFITAVLVVTPGPIVTLVIATGAREGTRAANLSVSDRAAVSSADMAAAPYSPSGTFA